MFSPDQLPALALPTPSLADRLRRFARLVVAFATLEDTPGDVGPAAGRTVPSAAEAQLVGPAARAGLVPPVACAPHPHRRPLQRRGPERRHGAAPARAQHCLTPVGTTPPRPADRARAARSPASRS